MGRAQRNINIIMLLLFSAYAIYTVLYQHASIFFIVYLFWFDELIRNTSTLIQVKMHVEDVQANPKFTKKQAIGLIKTRFFFLFVYSVFIIFAFGIFFNLAKESNDELIANAKIIVFRDVAFNLCLLIAIAREILIIRAAREHRNELIPKFNAMSGNLLTLHLSIILGAFLWALTSGKFKGFNFTLGSFNEYAIILPFFIIKFLVDFYQIKNAGKSTPSLLNSLQE